jgi:hypothetical protein
MRLAPSWTIYDFYTLSKNYSLGGCLEMPLGCTSDDTTHAVLHLFVQTAHEENVEIDLSNVLIIIRKCNK